jgi:hypothetical protein
MSQLVEECYFEKIEVFYLIVGHTHNILDQWFSQLGKAVRAADFIGSVLALHALYKLAHDDDEKDKRPSDCYQLTTYRDYRKYYNPVRNDTIRNYPLPHRTKFELDKHFGTSYYQYMFQSPQYGATYLEKWQPVRPLIRQNTMNENGNILLRPFATVNGEEFILKELGVECTGDIPTAINRESSADKLVRAASVLPLLRKIEKEAIAENTERMNQEEETGESTEKIKLTSAMLKAIDAEMIKHNSSSEGNIVWLKRSKCEDPDWLKKAPDVLPNPRRWREILADDDTSSQVPATTTSNSAINLNDRSDKISQAELSETRKRLLAFTRGASDMAATATELLSLVNKPGGIPVDENETDIFKATRGFRQRCLTKKEVQFYESIKSTKLITFNAERRALAEEAKPWRLLNLPEVSEGTRARLLEVQQQRAQQLAETEKNIKEILARRGEGEYDPNQQVVSFEGFMPPNNTKDLDKMTKDELITLAKGYIKNVRAMKKPELLKQLKAFIVNNPGKILLGTEAVLREEDNAGVENNTGVEGEPPAEDMGEGEVVGLEGGEVEEGDRNVDADMEFESDSTQKSCSIMECDGTSVEDLIWCDECKLWFCKDLHGPHKSHSAQTHYKEGRCPELGGDIPVAIVEQPQDANVTGKKRKNIELDVAMQSEQTIDLSRVSVATRKLREILSKPSKNHKEQLRSALNFTSYDIAFLIMVANEFGIDISCVTNKSRASRAQVLDYLLAVLD